MTRAMADKMVAVHVQGQVRAPPVDARGEWADGKPREKDDGRLSQPCREWEDGRLTQSCAEWDDGRLAVVRMLEG
eukprot:2559484-Rhodomonas_salina.3